MPQVPDDVYSLPTATRGLPKAITLYQYEVGRPPPPPPSPHPFPTTHVMSA